MFYNEKIPLRAAKQVLVERRTKLTESQHNQVKDISDRLNIPEAVLIRMAVDAFLPRIVNFGFTEKGVKAGYANGNYY